MLAKLKNILRNSHVLSLLSNATPAVFGMLSFMFLMRAFKPEEFGAWVIYLTLFSFMEMIKAGLCHTALIKYISGQEEKRQQEFIGSSWVINLVLTGIIISTIGFTYILPNLFDLSKLPDTLAKALQSIDSLKGGLFFTFYPFLSLAMLPITYAQWILQAKNRFDKIFKLNLFFSLLFVIVSGITLLYSFEPQGPESPSYLRLLYSLKTWLPEANITIHTIAFLHLAIYSGISIYCMFSGISGIQFLKKQNRNDRKALLNFGKFSIGTFVGTNLLSSSDTLLIRAFLVAPTPTVLAAIAFYYAPLKLIELLDMPIRSFVANALPKMSAANNRGDKQEMRQLFYNYSGTASLIFIIPLIIAVIFSEEIVTLFAGAQYVGSANIFRVFMIVGIFMSLDRFIGISLDAMNKPKYNFIKVVFMTVTNIAGDIIVLKLFNDTFYVAIVTIATIFVGMFIGYWFLNKELKINILTSVKTGWNTCQTHALELVRIRQKKGDK